jgi:hypothetical protein
MKASATTPTPPMISPLAEIIKPQRIFVGDDVTKEFLIGLLQGRTDIQAQKLVSLYLGKWMKVSGRLGNILSSTGTRFQVTFEFSGKLTDLYMWFGEQWADRLSIITPGQNLVVIGKITEIGPSSYVSLDECELLDS